LKLIGMIHLPPLPGSPGYTGLRFADYVEYALSEAEKLVSAGFDGVLVENYMDYPFSVRVENRAQLAVFEEVVNAIREKYPGVLLGVNILRNSGVEAALVACSAGADFIRVNAYSEPVYAPEGFLEPVARDIWSLLREKNCSIGIYADVNVKHAKPILDYTTALYNTCTRGRVAGVVVSGWATGYETPPALVAVAKQICRSVEVWVGSGVNHENVGAYIGLADAAIVGTSIKVGGLTENPVDPVKAKLLVEKLRTLEKRVAKQLHRA